MGVLHKARDLLNTTGKTHSGMRVKGYPISFSHAQSLGASIVAGINARAITDDEHHKRAPNARDSYSGHQLTRYQVDV